VCGAAPKRVHEAREMRFGLRDVFHYGECRSCPLLWLLDPPRDWSRFYPARYQSFTAPRRHALARLAARARDDHALRGRGLFGGILERFAPDERLRALRPLRPGLDARILDVGAGEGAFVRSLRRLGFDDAVGLDPFLSEDVVEGGGVLVHRRRLEEMTGTFDLVTFHHSFEHMEDPRAVLGHARTLLRPGGSCVIRIPVFPSSAWETYGTSWVQLDPPRHRVIHSVASMAELARGTGFWLRDVRYDSGVFQFWGSEQYAADVPLIDPVSGRIGPKAPPSRRRRREMQGQADRANAEERGDQAVFYLE
jgi:SAM-dependent methyltransferase